MEENKQIEKNGNIVYMIAIGENGDEKLFLLDYKNNILKYRLTMNIKYLQETHCMPESDGLARIYTENGKPLYKFPAFWLDELAQNK